MSEAKRNEGTKIKPCSCLNEYQDKLYGKGRRVHNICNYGNSQGAGARCTSCAMVKAR